MGDSDIHLLVASLKLERLKQGYQERSSKIQDLEKMARVLSEPRFDRAHCGIQATSKSKDRSVQYSVKKREVETETSFQSKNSKGQTEISIFNTANSASQTKKIASFNSPSSSKSKSIGTGTDEVTESKSVGTNTSATNSPETKSTGTNTSPTNSQCNLQSYRKELSNIKQQIEDLRNSIHLNKEDIDWTISRALQKIEKSHSSVKVSLVEPVVEYIANFASFSAPKLVKKQRQRLKAGRFKGQSGDKPSSFFSKVTGLLSKKEDNANPAHKMKLGDKKNFKYDPVKKKYIFEGEEEKAEEELPPPPMDFNAQATNASRTMYADPFGSMGYADMEYTPGPGNDTDEEDIFYSKKTNQEPDTVGEFQGIHTLEDYEKFHQTYTEEDNPIDTHEEINPLERPEDLKNPEDFEQLYPSENIPSGEIQHNDPEVPGLENLENTIEDPQPYSLENTQDIGPLSRDPQCLGELNTYPRIEETNAFQNLEIPENPRPIDDEGPVSPNNSLCNDVEQIRSYEDHKQAFERQPFFEEHRNQDVQETFPVEEIIDQGLHVDMERPAVPEDLAAPEVPTEIPSSLEERPPDFTSFIPWPEDLSIRNSEAAPRKPVKIRRKRSSANVSRRKGPGTQSSMNHSFEDLASEDCAKLGGFSNTNLQEELEMVKVENEELYSRVRTLNQSNASNMIKIQQLEWDKEELAVEMESLRNLLLQAEKARISASSSSNRNTSDLEICEAQLALSKLENDVIMLENQISLKDIEKEELKLKLKDSEAQRTALTNHLDRMKLDGEVTSSYFREERSRLQQIIANIREENKKLKESNRIQSEELEFARADLEEKEIKVEYLMQSKSKTDIELKKAQFDRKQAEEDYEALMSQLQNSEEVRRALEEENHHMRMEKMNESISEPAFEFQAKLQQAEMQQMKYQYSLKDEEMKNHALTEKVQRLESHLDALNNEICELTNRENATREEHQRNSEMFHKQKDETERLYKKIERKSLKSKDLKAKMESIQTQFQHVLGDNESMNKEVSNLKTSLAEKDQESLTRQESLNALSQKMMKKQEKLQNTRINLQNTEKSTQDLKELLEKQLEESKTHNLDLSKQFDDTKQHFEGTIEDLKKSLEEERTFSRDLQDSLEDTKSAMESQLLSIRSAEETNESLSQELNALKASLQEKAKTESDNQSLKLEIAALREDYAEKSAENERLQVELESMNLEKHSHEQYHLERQRTLQQDIEYAQNERDQIFREMNDFKVKTQTQVSSEVEVLQQLVTEKESDYKALLEERSREQEVINTLESSIYSLRQSLLEKEQQLIIAQSSSQDMEDLRYKLAEAKASSISLDNMENENSDLKSKVNSLQSEIERLYEQQLESEQEFQLQKGMLEKTLQDRDNQLKISKEEYTMMKQECQRLMSEMTEVKVPDTSDQEDHGWFSNVIGSIFLTDKERGLS